MPPKQDGAVHRASASAQAVLPFGRHLYRQLRAAERIVAYITVQKMPSHEESPTGGQHIRWEWSFGGNSYVKCYIYDQVDEVWMSLFLSVQREPHCDPAEFERFISQIVTDCNAGNAEIGPTSKQPRASSAARKVATNGKTSHRHLDLVKLVKACLDRLPGIEEVVLGRMHKAACLRDNGHFAELRRCPVKLIPGGKIIHIEIKSLEGLSIVAARTHRLDEKEFLHLIDRQLFDTTPSWPEVEYINPFENGKGDLKRLEEKLDLPDVEEEVEDNFTIAEFVAFIRTEFSSCFDEPEVVSMPDSQAKGLKKPRLEVAGFSSLTRKVRINIEIKRAITVVWLPVRELAEPDQVAQKIRDRLIRESEGWGDYSRGK